MGAYIPVARLGGRPSTPGSASTTPTAAPEAERNDAPIWISDLLIVVVVALAILITFQFIRRRGKNKIVATKESDSMPAQA